MVDPGAITTWLVIGGIAGWMAGLIVEGYGFGLLGNVVVGVAGAALASVALLPLGFSIDTRLGNTVVATVGAVVLLLAIGVLRRR